MSVIGEGGGGGNASKEKSERPGNNDSASLWEQVDNQIISLILTSIESYIESSYVYLSKAKKI
jgi:hypothetical protein